MGVISFGDDRPVFGSSASFIRRLIDQAIDMHGKKDYLLHCYYQMEWAYNTIYMEQLHVDEIREFAAAVEPFRAHYLAIPNLHPETRESVEQLTDELATALKIYLAQRVAHGEFTVERDFWTLRSLENEKRRLSEPLAVIPDPDAFAVELAERVHHTLHLMMRSPAILGGAPLERRLGEIGAHIGKFPDALDHPEAAFRLLEDGMDCENEDLSKGLFHHLVPVMVEASAKAGTWEALQRHLGAETRKWATEYYETEVELQEEGPLFPSELQRIEDLIDAARAGDWNRFRALSEEPYVNEKTMRDDQFARASAAIGKMKRCSIVEASAVTMRGGRFIHATAGDPTAKGRISIFIENVGNREGGPFGVSLFTYDKRRFPSA